jgi:hypothetical protein
MHLLILLVRIHVHGFEQNINSGLYHVSFVFRQTLYLFDQRRIRIAAFITFSKQYEVRAYIKTITYLYKCRY